MNKRLIIALAVGFVTFILLTIGFFNYMQLEEDIEEFKEGTFSIQKLINDASPGDTIHIPSGIYYETITINKPLNIIGKNKENTIIDGKNDGNVICIEVDNVEITNFTIRNSGGYLDDAGIKIISDNNLIKDCVLYRTKTGIYLDETKNNLISNCFFHTNGEGIFCYNSKENIIEESQFHHNAFGIHLLKSIGTFIKNSYIHTNGLGIYGEDSTDVKVEYSSIEDNNQDGGGVWLFDCNKFKFYNCNINHNGVGIKLKNSDGDISFCSLHQNMFYTILLEKDNGVIVSNCDIRDSLRSAFFIKESQCVVNNNNIVGSLLYGLECDRNSNCDARNNWWGSKLGPSLTEPGLGEKISFRLKSLRKYTWEKNEIGEVGASWSTKDVFTKLEVSSDSSSIIKFDEKDTDLDGCPDWWEEKWGYNPNLKEDHEELDPDGDALNNIEECFTDKYGSDPFYKDIFIEYDWIENSEFSNELSNEYIQKSVRIFKDHEINLHIDTGNLGGGEEIPIESTSSVAALRDIYWDYFLDNNLSNPRKGIFRYCLIMNENEETWGGFVFVGWDHLDTISMCIQTVQNGFKLKSRERLIIGGIIHELGHLMGLVIDDHEGIDNNVALKVYTLQGLKYKNYESCLNYRYVYDSLSYSDGSHGKGDFDDWSNLDFSFFKNTHFEWSKEGDYKN